jgi:hypothetical protein
VTGREVARVDHVRSATGGAHRLNDDRASADTQYAAPVLFGDLLDPVAVDLAERVSEALLAEWTALGQVDGVNSGYTNHVLASMRPAMMDYSDVPLSRSAVDPVADLVRWAELVADPSPIVLYRDDQAGPSAVDQVDYATAYAIGDPVPEPHIVHDFHDVPRNERTGPLPIIPATLAVPVNRVHTVLRDTLGLDWHQNAADSTVFDLDGTDAREWQRWTRGQLDRMRGPMVDVTGEYVRQLADAWPVVDQDTPRLFRLGRQDYPKMDPSRLVSHVAVIVAAVWLAWGASAHIVTGWFFVAVGVLVGLEGLRLVFPSVTARCWRWGRHRAAAAWKRTAALGVRWRKSAQPPDGGSGSESFGTALP